MAMIQDRIHHIRNDIQAICQQIGRSSDEIKVIGISKYVGPEQIREAVGAGLIDIGENRVQDATDKFVPLKQQGLAFQRHLVGHLQTNKVKQAVELFDIIHSVDSEKLAREIQKRATDANKKVDVLIQVNVSGEEQKYGVKPSRLVDLVNYVDGCDHVVLNGLMTMAPLTDDEGVIRACFKGLKAQFDLINSMRTANMSYLSMGMTQDYKIAIEEGSNMLRIGRAIFVDDE